MANDISEKPIKVNKWETNAVKNALDDACKKVGFLLNLSDESQSILRLS